MTGRSVLLLAGIALIGVSVAFADVLDTTIQVEQSTNQESQASQQRIDRLADQTEDALAEYRRVTRETENLRIYNGQLEQIVTNQRNEIESIQQQLTTLEDTNRGVVPLMVRMVEALEAIVKADLPFRLSERRGTVANLKDVLTRGDVTTSEKFRRVVEAYQREIDYGRNPAAYEGTIPSAGGGEPRTVWILKVGRTLLAYQTKDGSEVGWFNPESRQWEPLSDDYRRSVSDAIAIARNEKAPDLVRLPVPAAETAQ